VKPNLYSYAELRVATDDFNPSNKLGEGGFGVVYKVRISMDFYEISFVFLHGSDSHHINKCVLGLFQVFRYRGNFWLHLFLFYFFSHYVMLTQFLSQNLWNYSKAKGRHL
jgi:hypothetical protein